MLALLALAGSLASAALSSSVGVLMLDGDREFAASVPLSEGRGFFSGKVGGRSMSADVRLTPAGGGVFNVAYSVSLEGGQGPTRRLFQAHGKALLSGAASVTLVECGANKVALALGAKASAAPALRAAGSNYRLTTNFEVPGQKRRCAGVMPENSQLGLTEGGANLTGFGLTASLLRDGKDLAVSYHFFSRAGKAEGLQPMGQVKVVPGTAVPLSGPGYTADLVLEAPR